MTLRRPLLVTVLAALLVPASAHGASSFRMQTPRAGDVTLARVLVDVKARGRARPGFIIRAVNRSGFSTGVRAAALGSFPVFSPHRSLADVFVVLAAPTGTDPDTNPSALTVRFVSRTSRSAIVRLLVVPNALARDDSDCPTLSDGFTTARSLTIGWLMSPPGARWAGISARRFGFDAYSYGCGDGVQAGGGLFAQALLAPLTDLTPTWRHLPDGRTKVCEYITGAPGTRGTIELFGAGGSLGAQPYELSPDGYGLVAWAAAPGTYHAEFRTARANGAAGAFTVAPPPQDGPDPGAILQLAAGSC